MLKLEGLHTHYGKSHVLRGVDLEVKDGEAVALLGRNGVGKTTTLRSIMGLTKPSGGAVTFAGTRLDRIQPHLIAGLGLGYVPQGRRIFPNLSVLENLCIGLARPPGKATLDEIYAQFPILEERADQSGGTLSGGEQQMLAIARCLIMKPKMLLLDEPTEGIMPKMVATLKHKIRAVNEAGISILLVEQNFVMALALCPRIYIMEKGVICYQGTAQELHDNSDIAHRFLGVAVDNR
ncbi:MAG: ABC transporter ATP-binding protein [Rhodospirillales bacterium]